MPYEEDASSTHRFDHATAEDANEYGGDDTREPFITGNDYLDVAPDKEIDNYIPVKTSQNSKAKLPNRLDSDKVHPEPLSQIEVGPPPSA